MSPSSVTSLRGYVTYNTVVRLRKDDKPIVLLRFIHFNLCSIKKCSEQFYKEARGLGFAFDQTLSGKKSCFRVSILSLKEREMALLLYTKLHAVKVESTLTRFVTF